MSKQFLSEFTFDNYACKIAVEKIIDESSDILKDTLKIKNNLTKKINFSYQYGQGLKIINNNKKNNPLGEFLGIKKNDINALKIFFENYGYLFMLHDNTYTEIDTDLIFKIQKRLLAFILLINNQDAYIKANTINKPTFNIQELLDSILFLLLKDYNDTEIENSYPILPKETFNQNITTFPLENDNNALIYISENGREIPYYIVEDNIIGEFKIERDIFHNKISSLPTYAQNIYKMFILKNNWNYTNTDKLKIDFLFHLINDYSCININNFRLDGFSPNIPYHEILDNDNLVKSIFRISKILITDEFERCLKKVTPTYDVEQMVPSWKLNSLIDALYFSIYYKNSRDNGFRKCANEYCGEYFEVSKTNQKKKYCSLLCSGAHNQRIYQKRKNKGF